MFATQSVDPRIAKYNLHTQLTNDVTRTIDAINNVKTTLVQINIARLMATYSTSDPYTINTTSYSIGLTPSHAILDAAVAFLESLNLNY
jgi:hypothetical protein